MNKATLIILALSLTQLCQAQFRNTNRDYHPKWYPDSKSLVFYSYRLEKAGVYKIDIETGKETLITDKLGSHPNVSPDGKWIVYCLRDNSGKSKLNIIDANTGKHIREIDHQNPELHAFHPAWTPNGKILFNVEKRGFSNLMIVNLDGSGLKTVVNDKFATTPSPFDNGKQMVFGAPDSNSNRGIYTSDINGENIQLISTQDYNYLMPEISPNGKHLVYISNQTGRLQVHIQDLITKKEKQLTFGEGDNFFPRWSPDGSKIAVASEAYGFSEVVVMNADGSNLKNITSHSVDHGKPVPLGQQEFLYLSKENGFGQLFKSSKNKSEAITDQGYHVEFFTPDSKGKQVYFYVNDKGVGKIFMQSLKNKKVKEIGSHPEVISSFNISKDGKWIAFEGAVDGNSDILLLNLTNGKIEPLISSEQNEGNPVFHPTENKLIYNSDVNGNFDLYEFDLSTKKSKSLTNSQQHEVYADYSPDGNKIVFTIYGENDWDLELLDLSSGERSSLTSFVNFEFYPKWSKDGKKILFESSKTGSIEVYEIDIKTKTTKQLTKQ